MEALPRTEQFLRATLKASVYVTTNNVPVQPAPYKKPGIAVVYRLMSASEPKLSSDSQLLYSEFLYQVVGTTVDSNIGSLVDVQSAIKSALHFDYARKALLPADVYSCRCLREISFPEDTSRDDVRQNLGYFVEVVIRGAGA